MIPGLLRVVLWSEKKFKPSVEQKKTEQIEPVGKNMIPLPNNWSESLVSRWMYAQAKPGHSVEIKRSKSWCAKKAKAIFYFWGWWLFIGMYWLILHERTHAWHVENGWPAVDCPHKDCVMARQPSYLAICKRRLSSGKWHCEECLRRLEEKTYAKNRSRPENRGTPSMQGSGVCVEQ